MNVNNALKAALVFTLALVGLYGTSQVASGVQNESDSLSAKSSAGNRHGI